MLFAAGLSLAVCAASAAEARSGCEAYAHNRKVTGTVPLSAALSAAMLLFFFGLWFGLTLYRRAQTEPDPPVPESLVVPVRLAGKPALL